MTQVEGQFVNEQTTTGVVNDSL